MSREVFDNFQAKAVQSGKNIGGNSREVKDRLLVAQPSFQCKESQICFSTGKNDSDLFVNIQPAL